MMTIWKCFLLSAVSRIAFVSADTNDCKDFHHKTGPRIYPCVKEITLNKGQNYTLTCQGKTEIKFVQQEIPEEKIGNFNISPRNAINNDTEYKYEVALDLINIDRYAIGFYACMDASVAEGEIITLNSLIMEPNDTEYISYIYIYVNGTDSLFAPMRSFVTCKSNYYIVECRPTTADVEVNLTTPSSNNSPKKTYSAKIGRTPNKSSKNKLYSPKIGFVMKTFNNNGYTCDGRRGFNTSEVKIRNIPLHQQNLSKPNIIWNTQQFLEGDTVVLNCTATYKSNSALTMNWTYPETVLRRNSTLGHITQFNNNNQVTHGVVFNVITIVNATKEHAGKYICDVINSCTSKTAYCTIEYLDKPYLKLMKSNTASVIEHKAKAFAISVDVDSYPPINVYQFYKDDVLVKRLPNSKHYNEEFKDLYSQEAVLSIDNTNVKDSANYTFFASNGLVNSSTTFDVRIKSNPKSKFGKDEDKDNVYCVQGMKISYLCEVTGYPLPQVKWMFNGTDLSKNSYTLETKSLYKVIAKLDLVNCVTGNISCWAKNTEGETLLTKNLLMYELAGGFGISGKNTDKIQWHPENQDVTITCLASKYSFQNVTWLVDGINKSVEIMENEISRIATLKISTISPSDAGNYTCRGIANDGTVTNESIYIQVVAREDPVIEMDYPLEEVFPFQPVRFSCQVHGVPQPAIEWHKDNELLVNDSVITVTEVIDYKTVNSSILINQIQYNNGGTYTCLAISDGKEVSKSFQLNVKSEPAMLKYIILIGVIIVAFIILIIYLTWRDKKRKQRFKKELAKAGLLYFKKGATRSLNPELGIDEQADLLPYDERFEFAFEKLILGKQLGAGAFGVVYKADARGIINAEQTTTVAVKMVKKTADNMYIKALASELKIMIHLGKHINIVNLLGACTRNVVKRELVVIVEYCKFGNIHNYMQRHREVFIDQLSDNTKEQNLGKVNIGFSHSGSTGVQSEYFGSVNTQDTFLNSANTNRPRQNIPSQPTEVAKASESYMPPEWRSNYDGDYCYEGLSPRPLTSRDLISWAFQIARGMEYLASRKVLHGDLAARNVLLAEDNIVKICDFGLARSMYKNDEYKKKENSPLPVKWLAIECMTDQIFSTQSDVWSFGVVLWELFTLAKTPYPNINPTDILQFLIGGHRLSKPRYADDKIYNLMKQCWEQKPTARPSFSKLQEILDSYLEDSVRNHYVHLSAAYMDGPPADKQDYLAMVCAPDYNNMITPSPHHYVNNTKSFFPNTPTKVDEAGYQQMTSVCDGINSPRPVNSKFDFDARGINTRTSVASNEGSELTPMLPIDKVPRSSSDSDHEAPASPNDNISGTKIDEDEVFQGKQQRNAQNTAVTNPTYITFDIDEKKTLPITNYVNVPNGLVK